jgi:hypothetical protein
MKRLWAWLRVPDPRERFLAAASDHVELERRLRLTERPRHGSVFVTFNH